MPPICTAAAFVCQPASNKAERQTAADKRAEQKRRVKAAMREVTASAQHQRVLAELAKR